MSITNEMRAYTTILAIKEMFGDKEFTEKQYAMIRELTGNTLCSLKVLFRARYTNFGRYYRLLESRKEAIYLNPKDGDKAIFFEKGSRAPLSIEEYNNLPEEVHRYVKKNATVDVNKKVGIKQYSPTYRNKYKLNSKAIDNQKEVIKEYCSDDEVERIQNKIQSLLAQLEAIKSVLNEID